MCSSRLASCVCSLPDEHEGPHVCECKGSWADDGSIQAWPEEYVGPPEGRIGFEEVMPLLRDLTDMFPLPGPPTSNQESRDE